MALRLDLKIAEESGDWELQYIERTGRSGRKQEFVLRTGLSRGDTERHPVRFDATSGTAMLYLRRILEKTIADIPNLNRVLEVVAAVLLMQVMDKAVQAETKRNEVRV